jgi:hypothetical protein
VYSCSPIFIQQVRSPYLTVFPLLVAVVIVCVHVLVYIIASRTMSLSCKFWLVDVCSVVFDSGFHGCGVPKEGFLHSHTYSNPQHQQQFHICLMYSCAATHRICTA